MILHLITNFASRGGAESMLARIVSARPDRPVRVVSLKDLSDDNRRMIRHPSVEFLALGARYPWDLAIAAQKLARIIRKDRPDAVLCWMYHANLVGAVAGRLAGGVAPVFWNVRGSLDPNANLSASSRAAIRLGAAVTSWADGVIFNSSRAVGNHAERGYSHPNTRVIPNGFPLPEVTIAKTITPRVIGMAARFHPDKDHALFLKVAARLSARRSELSFVMAGRGCSLENPEFAALVTESGLDPAKLTLLGELTDMSVFYRQIDLFVLASRFEGFPNVVAEAMSHGVPAVATDVGDAAHVVGDVGAVAPMSDADAMERAVEDMLALDPSAFAALARRSRERVETLFDIGAVADQYDEFMLGSRG